MKNYTDEEKTEIENWYGQLSPIAQQVYDKYPPGTYQIANGAPYGLTAPGVHVQLMAYNDDGTVGVILLAKDKNKASLDHESQLCILHGHTEESMKNIHLQDVQTIINPGFLIKVDDNPEIWN